MWGGIPWGPAFGPANTLWAKEESRGTKEQTNTKAGPLWEVYYPTERISSVFNTWQRYGWGSGTENNASEAGSGSTSVQRGHDTLEVVFGGCKGERVDNGYPEYFGVGICAVGV